MKQVIFLVGAEEFGVDILYVEAIERSMPITSVPGMPATISGFIHLRGENIPVYDLRTRFGIPSKSVELMIVTKIQGIKIALAVDSVTEIVEAEDNEVITAPTILRTPETAFVSKVTNVKGHMFISLDFESIVTSEELKAIEQMLKEV